MKKALLFLLLTAFTLPAFASRHTDMEFRLLSPQSNTTIPPGGTFLVKLQVKNTGGDDLQSSDTILVKLIIDGSTFPFANPSGGITDTFLRLYNFYIAPGDSLVIFTQTFGFNDSDSHVFCLEGFLKSAAVNPSINDPNSANNKTCSQITFNTVGIAAVEPNENAFEIYPLPARNTLSWKSNRQFQPMAFAFYNLTGACVQQENAVTGNAPLDISRLPAGMYLLRATDKDGQILTRRFVKE